MAHKVSSWPGLPVGPEKTQKGSFMKYTSLLFTAVFAALFALSPALAATTSVGINVSRGQSDSMAYSLNITQAYEPWISTGVCELTPLAELGGHAWVDDQSGVDTVWGAYLAPGVRFSLFTDKSIRPYIEASVGGAVNSERKMDERDFGSNALFRTRGSIGIQFGEGQNHRIQGDYTHYSTWGITDTDDGYNTYGLSYGYSF